MFKFNDYFYLLLGLESFLYWSTFIISGMFLFTHITSLTQVLESKIPPIAKIVSLKSQKYLHVKPSYVSAPWVPGNLVVHVGHCLHLQVHLLELHLGNYSAFIYSVCFITMIYYNFVSQIFSWVLLVAFLIDLFFKYRSSPYVVSFLLQDHFDDLVHVAGRPQQGRDQQHQPLQKPVENISFVNLAYFF